jgi:hypothetical protein
MRRVLSETLLSALSLIESGEALVEITDLAR